jgi:hypothetical protein
VTQTPTDREQLGNFVFYAAVTATALGACLYGSIWVLPWDDSMALIRVTLRIVTFSLWGCLLVPGLYVLMDRITPGSLTAEIMGGNIAASIFATAVLFAGVALLFVH